MSDTPPTYEQALDAWLPHLAGHPWPAAAHEMSKAGIVFRIVQVNDFPPTPRESIPNQVSVKLRNGLVVTAVRG